MLSIATQKNHICFNILLKQFNRRRAFHMTRYTIPQYTAFIFNRCASGRPAVYVSTGGRYLPVVFFFTSLCATWSHSTAHWLERLAINLHRHLSTVGYNTETLCWLQWLQFISKKTSVTTECWAAHMVSGVHRCDHINSSSGRPALAGCQSKTGLPDGSDGLGVYPRRHSSLSQRPLHNCYSRLWSTTSVVCSNWHSSGLTHPDCGSAAGERSFAVNESTT